METRLGLGRPPSPLDRFINVTTVYYQKLKLKKIPLADVSSMVQVEDIHIKARYPSHKKNVDMREGGGGERGG